MNRVPKPNINNINRGNTIPVFTHKSDDKILFSFSALKKNDYFNLDFTCANWASDLFVMLKNISEYSVVDLIQGKVSTCRVHNHENAMPPSPLPEGVSLKDFYQIRISKSKGGIHGVFSGNVFYVIWFDPLHNMYPSEKCGGLRTIIPPKTCCGDREELIEQLQNRIKQLEDDCEVWEQLASEKSNG